MKQLNFALIIVLANHVTRFFHASATVIKQCCFVVSSLSWMLELEDMYEPEVVPDLEGCADFIIINTQNYYFY